MKIKVKFLQLKNKGDIQVSLVHDECDDREELTKHLDVVCQLIKNPKIEYQDAFHKSLVSIEKTEDGLCIDVDETLCEVIRE